jgi:DNA polymerase-3 subunit epsilon
MKKILWLDLETSGLDKDRNGIITMAAIVEIDGKIVEQMVFDMNPEGREIEDGALAVNGFTREQVASFKPWRQVREEFLSFLARFVDKFDKNDKFTLAGYNVVFDQGFLESWFAAFGDSYLFSWVNRFPMDVYRLVPFLEWSGVLTGLENRKLGTVCKAMGVNLDEAHQAYADIEATRQLGEKIKQIMVLGNLGVSS